MLRTGFVGRSRIDWATGTLVDYRAWARHNEQWVSTLAKDFRDRWQTVSTKFVTTYHHEQFTLETALGNFPVHIVRSSKGRSEHGLSTAFHGREGHRVTAAWLLRRKKSDGQYLTIHDWTTNSDPEHPMAHAGLGKDLAPHVWTVLPAFVLGLNFGRSSDLINVAATKGMRGFVVGVLAAGVWFAILMIVSSLRRRRFERNELPRLFAAIGDKDALPAEPRFAPAAPQVEGEEEEADHPTAGGGTTTSSYA